MGHHVIICGQLFTYEEKAPFVASGTSVLGALEYNQDTDEVKCHECGTWIRGLGQHIKVHKIKRRDYNERHGLRANAALGGMSVRKLHRNDAFQAMRDMQGVRKGKTSRPRVFSQDLAEVRNMRARCAAQLIFRIQTLAAQVGHTPTDQELRKAGITRGVIARKFGSHATGMRIAGLQPNGSGYSKTPIPREFPSKEEIERRFNERMAWPEDYFRIHPFERKRVSR